MLPTNAESEAFTLCSRRVVTPQGERAANVTVRGEQIVAVDAYDPTAGRDLGDIAILPGLVDPHVHLNEPGRTEWEGFETGTAAAAAGGITLVVDMPLNSSPVTTTAEALAAKREAAADKLSSDVAFYGGLVAGSAAQLPPLLDAGVVGVKAFLCDSGLDEFPAATEADLREAMPLLAERDVPLLVHAELISPAPSATDPRRYADYAATRPPKFESDAIRLLINLCREHRCRTHVVHLADGGCLPMLAAARDEGLPLTVETCPHYLHFSAEEIPDGSTVHKCAPPIRDAANREALWQGLSEGVIDLIGSDHSPCPPDLKHSESGRFDQAWGGISSLQLGLSIVWTEGKNRGITLSDIAQWMSSAPADLVGVASGIAMNQPANLTLFDPDSSWTVHAQELHHRHAITPYDGKTLCGVVKETYLRGLPATKGRGQPL